MIQRPLALLGFMGSGKSVVGAIVAERAGAPFNDLDLMIEHEAGMAIPEIFVGGGEPAFRALENRLLPAALKPGCVVALGGGSLIDDANWDLVGRHADTAYLEVPFQKMWDRIRRLTGDRWPRDGRATSWTGFSSVAGRGMKRRCIVSTATARRPWWRRRC